MFRFRPDCGYSLWVMAMILFISQASALRAQTEDELLYREASERYTAQEYQEALVAVQQAIALMPDNSKYQHLLGKCYGRLAEQAPWFKALPLARKTLKAFQQAVALDELNLEAWRDLQEYYLRAPRIIGGDRKRAEEIGQMLATHESDD